MSWGSQRSPFAAAGPRTVPREKTLFLGARAGMGTACAGRGLARTKARFPSWPAPTLVARGAKPSPRHRVHTSTKTPVHSDVRVVANTSRQRAAQQRFAVMHEIPIRISIRVHRLQRCTQILYRQVTRNTINQRANPDQRQRLAGVQDSGRPGRPHHDNHLSPLPLGNLQELPSQD